MATKTCSNCEESPSTPPGRVIVVIDGVMYAIEKTSESMCCSCEEAAFRNFFRKHGSDRLVEYKYKWRKIP